MARLLVGALHTHHGSAGSNLLVALGALLMSLCGTIVILSLCSLCSGRRRVGDKASSDGDSSPAKPASNKNSSTAAMAKSNESSSSIIKAEEAIGAPQAPMKGGLQEQKIPHRSPVWQRTILMGERCQRPTFSGLVLYDEKGNPLPRNEQAKM